MSGGNEKDLICIFKDVRPTDWLFSTHRSHYHALLKGISCEWLKAEILKGNSISINNAEYRFFSSAIVGGILPIAVGVAMTGQRVWAFVGEMAAETGIFNECVKFSVGHSLPITFVVEDNGFSVQTPTAFTWGASANHEGNPYIRHYRYVPTWPHQGTGAGTKVIF